MQHTAKSNTSNWRNDFPLINQKDIAFLDNASTTQKPKTVIDRVSQYYQSENANIHRGIYRLSEQITEHYEQVRCKVAKWIHAQAQEIIFCKGTTEALNLLAQSFLKHNCQKGGDIIVSAMEHHANLLPWQALARQFELNIKVIGLDNKGELDLDHYRSLLGPNTQLVTVTHVSNVLGTVNPVRVMAEMAHEFDVPICVDGAQAVAHLPINVSELGCDFYTFSGHKIYAPTGIGVLYASKKRLKQMQPYQVGGGIVTSVTYQDSQLVSSPQCFEAGTPNISGVIGLGAAIDYFNLQSWSSMMDYEQDLLAYMQTQLEAIEGLSVLGTPKERSGCLSFVMEDIHPHDIAFILDRHGVAVRAGHLCAMPLVKSLGFDSLTRASLAIYNQRQEVDRMCQALKRVKEMFHG